ncbi:hypothetical protein GBAR_LOCUS17198 [Geodia barretti]|uniref:Death domain-containing protein n=1 Tax=Geodia barretti TaxID=519541 RepID=A0AA35SHR4_GEOBA|nr:hypothetical protein GBAR_LOCUS17198 [Geodia barretti]
MVCLLNCMAVTLDPQTGTMWIHHYITTEGKFNPVLLTLVLSKLTKKVGVLLSADGYLHIYLDGGHIRKAASCLPVNQQLVDVYGRCTKIKSELLRGPETHEDPQEKMKQSLAASPISISGSVPTMPQLIKIKLPSQVGPKVTAFGTILLKDDLGNKVANIRKRVREDPEEMAIEVLREWLAGKGVEVSWESLIATLRDCDLSLMADQLTTALVQLS